MIHRGERQKTEGKLILPSPWFGLNSIKLFYCNASAVSYAFFDFAYWTLKQNFRSRKSKADKLKPREVIATWRQASIYIFACLRDSNVIVRRPYFVWHAFSIAHAIFFRLHNRGVQTSCHANSWFVPFILSLWGTWQPDLFLLPPHLPFPKRKRSAPKRASTAVQRLLRRSRR